MIRAGEPFLAGKSGGVIGAVIPWGNGFAGMAPAHIFHLAGTHELRIRNQKSKVAYFSRDADLAIFPLFSICEPSELKKPTYGDAKLVNAIRSRNCRISDCSWSIAYVVLPPGDLPGPGDSGTPIIQDGKVCGMLLSINLHNCKGTALSAELMMREMKELGKNQCD